MSKKLLVKYLEKILPGLTREIPENGIFSIGNDSSATLELNGAAIAPEQFVIVCEPNLATLMCRASGGHINGVSLPQGSIHNLQLKDVIGIGDYTLIFERAESVEALIADAAKKDQPAANSTNGSLPEKSLTARKKFGAQPKASAPQRSLNDVLEELRSDEKFYFQVETRAREKQRFYVESEEMWLGWSAAGECVVGVNTADIEVPRAQIRKDWSGVVLYPLQPEAIRLNSEALSEPRRLKNDDRLILLAKNKAEYDESVGIKFHEPTALLVLDTILPKKLPPPVSLKPAARNPAAVPTQPSAGGEAANRQTIQETARPMIANRKKTPVFGYFTLTEITVMTVGTLIASVVIFFILEYF